MVALAVGATAAGAAITVVVLGVVGDGLGPGGSGGRDFDARPLDSRSSSESETPAADTRLADAYERCSVDDITQTLSLLDAGGSVLVDTRSSYGAVQPAKCMFSVLGASEGLQAQVERTTALMGAQQQIEDGLSYNWTYHPDNGLSMVIAYST